MTKAMQSVQALNIDENVDIGFLFNESSLYVVIDSAMKNHLYLDIISESLEYRCLYQGQEAELLEEVAPYLVRLKEGHSFTHEVFDELYGHNAISFINSPLDIDTLASHLSDYAKIQIPMRNSKNATNDERKMQWAFFAFYDPRVFPQFVESNTDEQNQRFFQGIDSYYCENTRNIKHLNTYHFNNRNLIKENLDLLQADTILNTSKDSGEQTHG